MKKWLCEKRCVSAHFSLVKKQARYWKKIHYKETVSAAATLLKNVVNLVVSLHCNLSVILKLLLIPVGTNK